MATPIRSTIPVTAVEVLQQLKSDEDILTIARRLVKAGFISKAFLLDNIASLHPKVPRSLALRYLKQVCYMFGGEPSSQYIDRFLPNTKAEDTQLGLGHASNLIDILVKYAFKWRLIGTALRFQSQDLDNIQANHASMVNSNEHCLVRLVEDWLQQKHKHTLPPTKNSLQQAMRSDIVGLGDIACELVIKPIKPAADDTLPHSIIVVSEDFKSAKVTTQLVQTEENRSVLLEVQYEHHEKPVTYQWWQNGRIELSCTSPILCINGNINLDGFKFTCTIKSGSSEFSTIPITLKVSCPLDKYRQSLVSMYSDMLEVPEDTWPPESSKKYINLALIKQRKKLNYRNKYVSETIRNDLDDVLQHKKRIEYDVVQKSLKVGQVLFVEGRPGCGKTTFVHKITKDWVITNHGPIRLMLLVSLRVLNLLYLQKSILDLTDILKLFNIPTVCTSTLEARKGRGVCFIFDGLDEFSPRDANDSIVYKIIKKTYLSESTVIVASRPAAIAKWRGYANKQIEVLGFMKEQILEYFDSYKFSKELKSAELRRYLLSHPNIFHMCYLPIHSVMIAYLYEVTGEIPRTETEIYTHFMRFTLMRSLSKNVGQEEEIDVLNLKDNEKRLFNQICKLALMKTIENKQFLHQDEVRESFKNQTGGDVSLGLITIDRVADLYNYKNIYTFLHLTFQEYLAACHISTLSIEEQRQMIHEHGGKDHMLVVWKFYCGLMKMDSPDSMFKAVVTKTTDRTLHNIQCAYESQGENACNAVLENAGGALHFQKEHLTIPDFTALGYVLGNNDSSCPVSLSLQSPDTAGIDALLAETGSRTCVLRELLYSSDTFDDVMLDCLEKLLNISRSLEILQLSYPDSTPKSSLDAISEAIDKFCSTLTNLSVTNIRIGPNNMRCVLDKCKQLKKIALHDSFETQEIMILADKLKGGGSLEVLDIRCDLSRSPDISVVKLFELCSGFETANCNINGQRVDLRLSHQSSKSLETNLSTNKPIRLNSVRLNNCPSEVVSASADGIRHVTHLEALTVVTYELLDGIVLTSTTANALFSSLKHCSDLSTLDLRGSMIEKEGVECMNFQCWPNLQGLNLDGTENHTNIGRSGAEVLANNLDCLPHLSKLHLEYNNIDDELRLLLFRKLSQNKHFTALYLSNNPVAREWNRTIRSFDITTAVAQQSSTCILM